MAVCRKASTTVLKLAREWLLSVVDPHVCLQVAFFCKVFATALEVADKGLESRVRPKMDLEPTSSAVAFSADVALKGLFTGVYQ